MNTPFPQLRVKTGYSFRHAYGHIDEVIERLNEIAAPTAGIVDKGTWAHVKFERAAIKAGIQPVFGMEVGQSWILAKDTKAFYRLTSEFTRTGVLDLKHAHEAVRFVGGALQLPADSYDYADINPASYATAYRVADKARRDGRPMVLTSYNDKPSVDHASYAYAWEVADSVGTRHIATLGEMWDQIGEVMSRKDFDAAAENTYNLAATFAGQKLQRAPIIKVDGNFLQAARMGQDNRLADGHIKEWTQEYEDRFQFEVEAIMSKGFDSYFLVVADLIDYAKRHMLVGPGRGSSAGSLICYLLAITEVDPIPHRLLFQRFIDISRADLPDIDIDFPDTQRHFIFRYLQDKYGTHNVSKMGNVNTLQAASVLAQVGKKFGIPMSETMPLKDALVTYTTAEERYGQGLHDTMTSTDSGVNFAHKHPKAADCMGELETHPSHAGVHAAAILVCNEPVTNFCTVDADGVAQIDKPDAEYLNLLKIDALGLRTLGVIEDADVLTPQQLYALPLDDPKVIGLLKSDKVGGIFQFEGDTVRAVTRSIDVKSFQQIDHITALARPGPLSSGMTEKYIERASGKKKITYELPQLEPYLKDTYGVLIYQEQIMFIVRDIGNFDWTQTSIIRKAMSNSKGEEFFNKYIDTFIAGAATHGISTKDAKALWKELIAFGMYGFNQSHSVAYSVITYWTLYLKTYHLLDFCAATLRAAKDDEQTIAILRELELEGVSYVALDPELSDVNWKVVDGKLIGGILNAVGYGNVKADQYVMKRKSNLLTAKDRATLAKATVKFQNLHEAHTKWGHFYADPKSAGVVSGNPIIEIMDAIDNEDCLFIAKLAKKTILDENDATRKKKRGGREYRGGQSKFLEMQMSDDSVDGTIAFRIRPELYLEKGLPIVETALVNSWFLIKARKIPGFAILIVKHIMQLE